MRVIDRRRTFLYLSILSFYVSSFSIAFMPLGISGSGDTRTLTNTLAVFFWLGILAGIAFMLRVRKQRVWDIKYTRPKRLLPSALCFFSNKPAIAFDILLIIGVAMLFLTYNVLPVPDWLIWEFLFLTVFSLEMHFVFNGKNYIWLTSEPRKVKR